MTVYVLGAGASAHAGYPLAGDMGSKLLAWMKRPVYDPSSYAARYADVAEFLEKSFDDLKNIEHLVAGVRGRIRELQAGNQDQRALRAKMASAYGVLQNAVRDWFGEIQRGDAKSPAYREFAEHVVADGDCIITFNYDVSLERELKQAGKFDVGNGYGFSVPIERLTPSLGKSKTMVLKLHGSTSWLALLFGGSTSGPSSFQPGNTLSDPVIGSNELSFLGYEQGVVDQRFKNGGAALPVMIFPAPMKEFYFDVNTGVEYREFWDGLWKKAADALSRATHLVICGYSLLEVDERARCLLLDAPRQEAEISVASGGDTQRIVTEYRNKGYLRTVASHAQLFEAWVAERSASLAAPR